MSERFVKDPNATLDYTVDWSAWLGADTITASTWVVPDGITKDADSYTDTTTTIWLSGGTRGKTYDVVNHITTAGGRKKDQTLQFAIQER